MAANSWLIKMVTLSSTRCMRSSRCTAMSRMTMGRKVCMIRIRASICKNSAWRRIQSKTKLTRLFRFAPITMHCLVIPSFPPMTTRCTTIRLVHQSTRKICPWLSGRGLRRYLQTRIQKCKLIQRVQATSSKVCLDSTTAGSSVHC